MSKATEEALAELHSAVAKVLRTKMEDKVTVEDDDGENKEVFLATAQEIAVAVKFLNDNDITCDPSDSEDLSGIQRALQDRKKHSQAKSRSGSLDPVEKAING